MPSNKNRSAIAALSAADWLKPHSPDLGKRLVTEGQLVELGKGEWAQSEGDDRSGLFIVIAGRLQTYYAPHLASRGDQVMMLGFAGPGAVIGHATKYSGGPRLVTAVCAEPSTILEVSELALERIAADHPELWRAIADLTYANLQSALRLAAEFISLSPRQRIAARLLSLAAPYPTDAIPPIEVSQEILAEMVGTSRKTVNTHLSEFEGKGWVKLAYREIKIINPDILRNLMTAR